MTAEEQAERDALAMVLDTLINIAGAHQPAAPTQPRPVLVPKQPRLPLPLTGSDWAA